jgi:L-histidine Nalpha-methyltransferase
VPLVLVSRERALKHIDDDRIRPICCDLALARNLHSCLEDRRGEQRLITFFGMIPNFEPGAILPKLAELVRPGDTLLFSANLVPGPGHDSAMRRILPQYDNAETHDWLLTLLVDLGISREVVDLRFAIERVRGRVPLLRFIARAVFRRSCSVRLNNVTIQFARGEALQVFFSYRYTPETIRCLLERAGLNVVQQWIVPSGEEGVFHCERPSTKQL